MGVDNNVGSNAKVIRLRKITKIFKKLTPFTFNIGICKGLKLQHGVEVVDVSLPRTIGEKRWKQAKKKCNNAKEINEILIKLRILDCILQIDCGNNLSRLCRMAYLGHTTKEPTFAMSQRLVASHQRTNSTSHTSHTL